MRTILLTESIAEEDQTLFLATATATPLRPLGPGVVPPFDWPKKLRQRQKLKTYGLSKEVCTLLKKFYPSKREP
jgi:hypothetical protein